MLLFFCLSNSSRSCLSQGLCICYCLCWNFPFPRSPHGCLFLNLTSQLKCCLLQETFPDHSSWSMPCYLLCRGGNLYLKFWCSPVSLHWSVSSLKGWRACVSPMSQARNDARWTFDWMTAGKKLFIGHLNGHFQLEPHSVTKSCFSDCKQSYWLLKWHVFGETAL